MSYSAKAIANKFIKLSKEENASLSQMKLQKLIYISHGFSLALLDQPLIIDKIEAWQYGPIIPEIYHEFKGFGRSKITKFATNIEVDSNTFNFKYLTPNISSDDELTNSLIEKVWNKYKHLSGLKLSDLTHREGTPWSNTYVEGISNLSIENNIIKSYYKTLLEKK